MFAYSPPPSKKITKVGWLENIEHVQHLKGDSFHVQLFHFVGGMCWKIVSLSLGVFVGADQSANLHIQNERTHWLFELVHLWVYPTQAATTHIALARVLDLSFQTRDPVDPIHWFKISDLLFIIINYKNSIWL